MRAVMITAPNSGSGKTSLTAAIIRAMHNSGKDICGIKTGPDYIDSAFLSEAARKSALNIDKYIQGEDGMRQVLSLAQADYAIVEGVMGYFDGIYNTFENSSYDISKTLRLNSILVYSPKGEMFSAVVKIKGMVEFEGSRIKAVILNKVSKSMYNLLKEQIEAYAKVPVIGYMPELKELEIESRHLGLVQSSEIENLNEKLDKAAEKVRETIDFTLVEELMTELEATSFDYEQKTELKVAIAKDKAFAFCYRENLELFSKSCKVSFFSPLYDKVLPECDLLYLPGGYPEVFREELSRNTSMLESIRSYAKHGGYIYAECGGLMYLMENIEDSSMTGVLKGRSFLTEKLQHFGYVKAELKRNCLLGEKGDIIHGHEFHKSITESSSEPALKVKKAVGKLNWEDGISEGNIFASYCHISFAGNRKVFRNILKNVSMKRPINNA